VVAVSLVKLFDSLNGITFLDEIFGLPEKDIRFERIGDLRVFPQNIALV